MRLHLQRLVTGPATLHANNANQALDRIVHFFEADRHSQLYMDLSLNLKAVIAQQLIPTLDGNGRRAAIEVLINTLCLQITSVKAKYMKSRT